MFQIRWLWRNMTGKRKYLVMGLMLSVITMSMTVVVPKLSQMLIDDVIVGGMRDWCRCFWACAASSWPGRCCAM